MLHCLALLQALVTGSTVRMQSHPRPNSVARKTPTSLAMLMTTVSGAGTCISTCAAHQTIWCTIISGVCRSFLMPPVSKSVQAQLLCVLTAFSPFTACSLQALASQRIAPMHWHPQLRSAVPGTPTCPAMLMTTVSWLLLVSSGADCADWHTRQQPGYPGVRGREAWQAGNRRCFLQTTLPNPVAPYTPAAAVLSPALDLTPDP